MVLWSNHNFHHKCKVKQWDDLSSYLPYSIKYLWQLLSVLFKSSRKKSHLQLYRLDKFDRGFGRRRRMGILDIYKNLNFEFELIEVVNKINKIITFKKESSRELQIRNLTWIFV